MGESTLSYQRQNQYDVHYEYADSNIYPNIFADPGGFLWEAWGE